MTDNKKTGSPYAMSEQDVLLSDGMNARNGLMLNVIYEGKGLSSNAMHTENGLLPNVTQKR
jgi:hypothetical protein